MAKNRSNIYTAMLLTVALLSLFTDWYNFLSIGLTVLLLVMIVDKMGRGIVLRESTAMLYTITCLLMPVIGYAYYTRENFLARLWVKFMPVPADVYFAFALPAVAFFCLTITFPLGKERVKDEGETLKNLIVRCKIILGERKTSGIYLIIIGLLLGGLTGFLPAGLQFFSSLFFFGSFAGLLYVYFSPPFRYKKLFIAFFFLFVILNALGSGMFTIVAYMGITIFSFFLLGSSPSFIKKTVIVVLAVAFMIVLQNTKTQYREFIWMSNYEGSSISLFSNLFIKNFQQGSSLLDKKAFFPLYARANQGFNIALVMRRIPSAQEHDNGSNLMRVFLSAFVPRFLWADKPEAGGKFNMKHYAGINLRGWSTNVGPLGEAYGSFGVYGGIVYMFFLGLFIRWAYQKVFSLSKKIPLLICWIPVLFFQTTYSGETDTLQILNSLLKSAFFIFLIYRFLPGLFGIESDKTNRMPSPKPLIT